MDYKIRELKQNEISVLNTFLYEAIFIPDALYRCTSNVTDPFNRIVWQQVHY